MLYEDNLSRASLLRTVKDANPLAYGKPLDEGRMLALLRILSGVKGRTRIGQRRYLQRPR